MSHSAGQFRKDTLGYCDDSPHDGGYFHEKLSSTGGSLFSWSIQSRLFPLANYQNGTALTERVLQDW